MPRWGIGWDVFCWIGQRRFSRHWSVPQIRNELKDSDDMLLSDDAIEDHLATYQVMVAARHQDPQVMSSVYRDVNEVVLTIVREGPTLIPTLDAHASHAGLFSQEELSPYEDATAPPSQIDSQHRHRIMRKGQSKNLCRYQWACPADTSASNLFDCSRLTPMALCHW